MIPFRRRDDPFMLVIGMTGVKLGDRVLQIGCAHGGRLAAIAGKVGLSGRAVAVVPDAEAASRAQKGAGAAGVLVEIETAPPTKLPIEDQSFDLAVIDDTGGLFQSQREEERAQMVREAHRVLRAGGRAMVIGSAPRTGLSALFSRAPAAPRLDPAPALEAGGFRFVRTLAERDGLLFVEGLKARRDG